MYSSQTCLLWYLDAPCWTPGLPGSSSETGGPSDTAPPKHTSLKILASFDFFLLTANVNLNFWSWLSQKKRKKKYLVNFTSLSIRHSHQLFWQPNWSPKIQKCGMQLLRYACIIVPRRSQYPQRSGSRHSWCLCDWKWYKRLFEIPFEWANHSNWDTSAKIQVESCMLL